MSTAKFITFEGGEGAGKSTQARMLAQALEARGLSCRLTREPGGTAGAEAIRSLLLDNAQDWDARAEALLFAAARADHVENLIRPALAAGEWVICDRFIDSTRAYQGGGGGLDDASIMDLHRVGSQGLLPQVTVLVEVSLETAAERLAARDGDLSDRIGGKPAAYHAAVNGAFRKLADSEQKRFVIVDGDGDAQAVHKAVMQKLAELGTLPE